jgi:hypothetical protein
VLAGRGAELHELYSAPIRATAERRGWVGLVGGKTPAGGSLATRPLLLLDDLHWAHPGSCWSSLQSVL